MGAPNDSSTLLLELGEALANMPLGNATLDLASVVRVVLDVIGPEASPSTHLYVGGFDDVIEIEAGRSAVPLALFHVLLHAVHAANAVADGEVRVSFRRSILGSLFVEVTDNGPRRDDGALRRAFDLPRALLRAVGGDVEAKSTPTRGTAARIALAS